MRSILAAVLASAASLAAAQANVEEFWWSYPAENVTEQLFGYDPEFEICGGSCEACDPQAKQCISREFSNICYEPSAGETCCEDVYGTACVSGFYCAYNILNAAFCCKEGSKTEDCGAGLGEELSNTPPEVNPTATVVVTQIKTPDPTETAHQQAKQHSGLPTQQRGKKNKDGMSLGAKVGIAIGVIAVVGTLAGALAFFILRKRRAAKYGAHQEGAEGDFSKPTPGGYAPPTGVGVATGQYVPPSPAPPAYSSPVDQYGQPGAPGAGQSEYYKTPLQPAAGGVGSPYQENATTFRHDAVELAEMPAEQAQNKVYEMAMPETKQTGEKETCEKK